MSIEEQSGRNFTCIQRCLCNSTTYTDDDCKATHSPKDVGDGSGCLLLRCTHACV